MWGGDVGKVVLAGLGGDKGKGGKRGRDLCTVCR